MVTIWIDNIEEKIISAGNSLDNDCECIRSKSHEYFYTKFADDELSYDPANYSFSRGLLQDSLPEGKGIITRSKTWVWPKCSGFTSWTDSERSVKLHSVEGGWESGVMSGLQTFLYCNGVSYRAVFKCGVAQGLAIGSFKEKVVWVGRYEDGELVGKFCAIEPDGGALLTGNVTEGEMSGPDLTFLYPDMETGLRGSWHSGVMVAARQVVVNCVWVEEDQVWISCSADFGPEFAFSPSGIDNFGSSNPMMRDPYETKLIAVEKSKMEGGGEGVYAKVDMAKNYVAAIFNGFKVPLFAGLNPAEGIEKEDDIFERLSYNIHMPEDEDFFLDLPPAMADLKVYCASLGHKVGQSEDRGDHGGCEGGAGAAGGLWL
eukprot:GFUD01016609.1.p1 GENE.GFUD01016609.1~~GFUD01016609.1.p1  ORF type:complete len:373 (+),score=118.99 GFUD01016609.1:107-1225(+)